MTKIREHAAVHAPYELLVPRSRRHDAQRRDLSGPEIDPCVVRTHEPIGDNLRHAEADCKRAADSETLDIAGQFARRTSGCCKNFVYN